MRYVQRDNYGKVIAHFANEQSYAQELLNEDHPDLIAYRAERARQREEAKVQSPTVRIKALETKVRWLYILVGTLLVLIALR
jgi:hypothetical protein